MGSLGPHLSRNFYTRLTARRKAPLIFDTSFTMTGALGREVCVRKNGDWRGKTVCDFSKQSQLCGQFDCKLSGSETPFPISPGQAGSVHASFAAQAQHILQRDEGEVGHRILCSAYKCPMNAFLATAGVGLTIRRLFLGAPTHS